jgi:hypothetical protein
MILSIMGKLGMKKILILGHDDFQNFRILNGRDTTNRVIRCPWSHLLLR